ncbi:hypothetical protein E1B28_007487 [Marasmius oreades]|uniref:Uncharacterized protein n=1 Tax=Marasmius oreades TaxID=181124 RepID=A0A9P7S2A2_9AGAR|nr:uncharacterized protein E1B28_007487 [Marasmius oreades]KAG7093848.1 hypothetical protein E1B28_007487 [Marasmius oreades]
MAILSGVTVNQEKEKEYKFPEDSKGTIEKHKMYFVTFTFIPRLTRDNNRYSLKMKKDALKTLCQRYKLGVSGTIATLQGKLKVFSEDWDQWILLKAGAQRTHKGLQPVPGSKKKTLKGAQL